MTADPRITAAAEFLAHIRSGPKPSALPRIRIDREDAELRRQLGIVLHVLGEAAPGNVVRFPGRPAETTMERDAALALDALEVASDYRRYRAGLSCADCEARSPYLCESHETDLDRAAEYDDLAARIREQTS